MNRTVSIKDKVSKRLPICGTHINIADSMVSELMGALGYDFLWVDMEHTYLSCQNVHNHLMAARASGTPVFVRVPVDDLTTTKRILEIGVDGIIFPMIQNYEHACEVLSKTLYPPYGKRGCGPKGAVRYGLDIESDYYKDGHLKLCRFVQIELESAALDAERIASIPYLDGCVLGMHDLSGSIGKLGDIFCAENLILAKRAIQAFHDAGKTVGVSTFATDEKTLNFYKTLGIDMISTGADYDYILRESLKTLNRVRQIQEGT